MNWKERIENGKLEIKTADGNTYRPLWKQAEKNINFNTEGFDFRGKEGTYVSKKKASGAQYPFVIYFQGADHIEVAEAFLESAKDVRPAKLIHPYYNEVTVQILSLSQKNTTQNVSEFSGIFWETLTTRYPQKSVDSKSVIIDMKATLNGRVYDSYTTNFQPKAKDIQPAKLSVDVLAANNEKIGVSEELQVLKRNAEGAANNLLSSTGNFILSATTLIDYPFALKGSIDTKLKSLINSAKQLINVVDVITFDSMSSLIVGTSCTSAIDSNYTTTTEVLSVIDSLSELYDYVREVFDSVNYNQKVDIAIQLDEIVNLTIASLFEVAFDTKREREIYTTEDSDVIKLSHKYYGSEEADLQLFIQENKITLDEYITVPKGRKIKYFV